MKKNIALLLVLIVILALTGCRSDSNEQSTSEAAQSQPAVEEETLLPIAYALPSDYTAEGGGNHTTWTFDGQQDRITIDVTLLDNKNLLEAMSSSMETGSFSNLQQVIDETASGVEFYLVQTGGFDAVYLIGSEEEGIVLRYLLRAGDYVIDLRGQTGPDAVGLLQRHLEDVMATIEVEGFERTSTQTDTTGSQVDSDTVETEPEA